MIVRTTFKSTRVEAVEVSEGLEAHAWAVQEGARSIGLDQHHACGGGFDAGLQKTDIDVDGFEHSPAFSPKGVGTDPAQDPDSTAEDSDGVAAIGPIATEMPIETVDPLGSTEGDVFYGGSDRILNEISTTENRAWDADHSTLPSASD